MINLSPSFDCSGSPIPINVRFEIWDITDINLLASGDTGSINGTSSPNWQQYALVFQTVVGQSSVILKMRNNGVAGCGNDLALDDIVFKTCGDRIIIQDPMGDNSVSICENSVPYTTTLTATPDFTIFLSHFYQWQESTDGVNWIDVIGETSDTYTTSPVNNTTYYRVKVAEDLVNVNNDSCNSSSEIFEINIIPFPNAPISNGDLAICEDDTTPLSVTAPNTVKVNWYDAPVAGNLLLANNQTFNPTTSGIYYAEAETMNSACLSVLRTPVEITFFETPEVQDEALEFCENVITTINANVANTVSINESYFWRDTGEITESIDVSNEGTYTVEVSNGSCTVTKTIVLSQIDSPIIGSVESDGRDVIITTSNSGDFLYSLNGTTFQSSNIFKTIEGGLYTIYVKHRDCDEVITTNHIHFYIPKFFTPNGDRVNDTFNLKGIEFYSTSSVSIFNRYGKLLKNATNTAFTWNGSFNGEQLPTDDYWYVIVIDGQKFTGHFTLKR
jgi:gliding motility-associated-like protein